MSEFPAPCPRCGAPIGAAAPGGLCTRCLIARFAFDSRLEDPNESGESDAAASDRIGDYDLLEVLGRGGMGIVYKARQRSANRIVAIKLIAAGELASPELIHRFKSEAETAAALEHPGIVPVYDVGEADGRHFFSMQWIAGESLAVRLQRIRGGTAPAFHETEAARMVESLARAVHHAHQRGVLHRDIKPGNVLLGSEGEPRLTDFGLAKWLKHDTSLTRPGGILGTPAYMAPEQAAGRNHELTVAVDVYGLGLLLYELLAGVPAFTATTSYELIRKVIEVEPSPIASRNHRVGPDLETICLKCLEKDPGRRYPTAQALAEDLDRWRHHEPISARRSGPGERLVKWSRRHPALAVLGLAVAFGSLVVAIQQRQHAEAMRGERDAARTAQRRAEKTVENQRLISADGWLQAGKTADALAEWARILHDNPTHSVAAARIFSTLSHRNFVLPAAGTSLLPLFATTLEFSPDGTRILCARRGETMLRNTADWQPVPDTPTLPASATRAAWSPDGRHLALAMIDVGGLVVHDARTLAPLLPLMPLKIWSVPMFAPDGTTVAVAGGEGPRIWIQSLQNGTIREWDLDQDPRRRSGSAIVQEPHRVLLPTEAGITAWPLDPGAAKIQSKSLDSAPRRLRTRPRNPTVVVETGESRFLFLDAMTLETAWPEIALEGAIDDDFSPNSLLYASAQRERWGQLWDLTTGEPLGEPALRSCLMPRLRFTPNGEKLILFGDPDGTAICDARNGRMLSRAFRHAAPINHAEFSPDGLRILTASDDGTAMVWDAETGAAQVAPLQHGSKVRTAQFAAQGSLLVTVDTDDVVRVWDSAHGVLRKGPLKQPDFVHAALVDSSGTWLACLFGSGWNLYSLGSNSLEPVHREAGDKMPTGQFTPDGRTLLTLTVTDALQDKVRLWTPGESRPRWELPEKLAYIRAAVSDDARRVAVVGPTIRIWDVETSQPVGAPMPRRDEVWVVTFGHDGRYLLTAGSDRRAQIWDAETGEPTAEPMLHESAVWQAQFSPDGTRVLTSTAKGFARLWDVATGLPLTEPFPDHPVAVHVIMSPSTSARFSPDGARVILPCGDHAARFVELPPTEPPPGWLPEFVEALAGQRWGSKGIELLPWSHFYAARSRLASEESGGSWLAWARWLVADRLERCVTPNASRTTREQVDDWVLEGTAESLVRALQMNPSHAQALEILADRWTGSPVPGFPGRAGVAAHLKRRAATSPSKI